MKIMNKSGGNMEFLILFVGSIILCVLSGWLYLKKEDTAYDKVLEQVKDLRGSVISVETKLVQVREDAEVLSQDQDDINHRLDTIQVDIVEIKKPQTVNLVMKQPLKVLMKNIPSPAPSPTPKLPGLTPKLKRQVSRLSQ